jgi:anti-sigma-K factor RskA
MPLTKQPPEKKPEATSLKLFVVGESSDDPKEWGNWQPLVLALARNEAEVAAMLDYDATIREVRIKEPTIICNVPVPYNRS